MSDASEISPSILSSVDAEAPSIIIPNTTTEIVKSIIKEGDALKTPSESEPKAVDEVKVDDSSLDHQLSLSSSVSLISSNSEQLAINSLMNSSSENTNHDDNEALLTSSSSLVIDSLSANNGNKNNSNTKNNDDFQLIHSNEYSSIESGSASGIGSSTGSGSIITNSSIISNSDLDRAVELNLNDHANETEFDENLEDPIQVSSAIATQDFHIDSSANSSNSCSVSLTDDIDAKANHKSVDLDNDKAINNDKSSKDEHAKNNNESFISINSNKNKNNSTDGGSRNNSAQIVGNQNLIVNKSNGIDSSSGSGTLTLEEDQQRQQEILLNAITVDTATIATTTEKNDGVKVDFGFANNKNNNNINDEIVSTRSSMSTSCWRTYVLNRTCSLPPCPPPLLLTLLFVFLFQQHNHQILSN
jgi:hypothetical protein